LWGELADDVGWFAGKIASGFGILKPNFPRLKPYFGWANNITDEKLPS
jgi:hypothetical protein